MHGEDVLHSIDPNHSPDHEPPALVRNNFLPNHEEGPVRTGTTEGHGDIAFVCRLLVKRFARLGEDCAAPILSARYGNQLA